MQGQGTAVNLDITYVLGPVVLSTESPIARPGRSPYEPPALGFKISGPVQIFFLLSLHKLKPRG